MYTKVWSKYLMMVKPLEYVFASEEALTAQLQVGDNMKVNDGMGRNEHRLIGFPTSTTEFGDFTLTVTIVKIEEINGETFYRARVKWQKSRTKFILPDGTGDATISYFGDGSSVNVNIVASENDAEITSDAGLTESNSIYRGNYALMPKIETLPDCSYRMELCGEAITPDDLPKVVPNKDVIFSLVQMKDNKQRYVQIARVEDAQELHVRTFKVSPTPSDANVAYSYTANNYNWTQQNGTVYCYKGDTINYRITKSGYKTIEDSFTVGYSDTDLQIEMETMSVYRFVYPNGTFNVGDFVIINNGIGENSQEWTANALTDTDYIGPFTQQGEVKEIDPQTGYLTVEADVVDYPEVSIVADQSGATIDTVGDNASYDISVVSDQNGSTIETYAGLDTVDSAIRGYELCELDPMTGYTAKFVIGNTTQPLGQQILVAHNETAAYALVYNNRMVMYESLLMDKCIHKRSHTVNIVASESDATIKIYGAITPQIQAYSKQVISYEVSKAGFVTVSGTYTVPNNDCGNNSYTVSVTLEPEI